MRWLHTVFLPLATMLAVYLGIKKKVPSWKHGALILGCGLILRGLWLVPDWSTALLIAGCALSFLGIPLGAAAQQRSVGVDQASTHVASEPGTSRIHVSFPRPGFFMGDARVVLLLDGATVHEGSFKAGIDITIPAALGRHCLESVIELGIARRRRSWELVASSPGCDVVLEYSRFWGNFSKTARIGRFP